MMALSGTLLLTTDQVRDPPSSDPQTGISGMDVCIGVEDCGVYSGEFFIDESSVRVYTALKTVATNECQVHNYGCPGMELPYKVEVEMCQCTIHCGDLFVVDSVIYLATHEFATQACLVGTADIDESFLTSHIWTNDPFFYIWRPL